MRGQKLKIDQIESIKKLREKGYSLTEISNSLKIPKTTTFSYMKMFSILPDHISTWRGKRGGSRKRKQIKEAAILQETKNLISELSKKEKLLVASALYWAEGNKKDFSLTNTDPNLIYTFIEVIRDIFKIPNNRFRISIRIYEDLDREKCLQFWSEIVKIPKEEFVNVNILPGKKKGKLLYGMCRVRIAKGGDLLKKIKAVNFLVHQNLSL